MAMVIGLLGTRPIRKLLNGISVPFFAKPLLTRFGGMWRGLVRMAVAVRRSNAFPDFETAAPEIRYR